MTPMKLEVVRDCDNCGACCRHMVMPPFLPDFHAPENRNEEFDAFKAEWPALAAELRAEYERKMREDEWPESAPCFWYDAAAGRCKHHEARPEICRDFEVGSESCLSWREAHGITACRTGRRSGHP